MIRLGVNLLVALLLTLGLVHGSERGSIRATRAMKKRSKHYKKEKSSMDSQTMKKYWKTRPKRATKPTKRASSAAPNRTERSSLQCRLVGNNPGVVAVFQDDFCFEYIPGMGKSQVCSNNDETLTKGGAVCNLVSQTVLSQLQARFDVGVVITNAGIARGDIPRGVLTYDKLVEALPFNDSFYVVEMVGGNLLEVLEDSVESAAMGNAGAYPCGGGMRFSVNFGASYGSRVYNVEMYENGNWEAVNASRYYHVAASRFLIAGGDGYKAFQKVEEALNTGALLYDLFIGYAAGHCPVGSLSPADYATQQFTM